MIPKKFYLKQLKSTLYMNVNELQQLKIKELAELAAKLQIDSYSGMNKQ